MVNKTTMAANLTLNPDNAKVLLCQYIEIANGKGSFLLREASLLNKAMDTLNKDVKNKPDFGNGQDPETTAINLLIQGAHKGQAHGSYNMKDSALLWDIIELLSKENAERSSEPSKEATREPRETKETKETKEAKEPKSHKSQPQRTEDSEDEDEDRDDTPASHRNRTINLETVSYPRNEKNPA